MSLVLVFSSIAACIQAFSQIQYIYFLVNNQIVLNKTTWFVAAIVMVLSASSFFSVVQSSNGIIAAGTIIVAVSFVFIFLYSLVRGKFVALTKSDAISLVLAGATLVAWKTTGDARVANVILQLLFVISFVPTFIGLYQGALKERSFPWLLGVVASCFVLTAVYLESGFTNPVGLMYPFVVGIFLNGVVAVLALMQERGTLVYRG